MTGSVGDAEDIVQDAFLGLTRARQAGTTIADPKAYLATAVTRLGINYLAPGKPLHGPERVARLLAGLLRRGRFVGASLRPAWLNGQPGAVGYDAAGRVITVFELGVADGMVQAIRAVVNPDKLRHIGPVSDVARLPERSP